MLSPEQAAELTGATVFDNADEELGAVEDVFLNPADDQPAWAAVALEDRRVVVPLLDVDFDGTEIRIPYPFDLIVEAPEAPAAGAVDPDTQAALLEHYGISDADLRDDTGFSADRPVALEPGSVSELAGVPADDGDDVGDLSGGRP